MAKCYLAVYENCAGEKQHYFICANSLPSTEPFGCGVRWIIDGGYPFPNDSVKYTNWSQVPNSDISLVPVAHRMSGTNGSCSSCPTVIDYYDCINGACTKKSVYNTPGLYQSLSECEVVCGTGCSGKCISNTDWTQIENLSGELKNRSCS